MVRLNGSTLPRLLTRNLLMLLVIAAVVHPGRTLGQTTATVSSDHPARARAGLKLFRERVRPLLTAHCLECHGGKSIKGDFDLSTREKLGESGYVGQTAAESYLVELIEHRAEPAMPFKRAKLPEESIALIRQWIDLGAPYDRPLVEGPAEGAAAELVVTDEDRQFWSFRPLAQVAPPAVADDRWSRTPVDRFILARQREAGLTPNGAADRRLLIRRACFDLLGLPPTPEEVEAFVQDPDPAAWERLVDRLLDDQHYGERWARHWMDVARFAESHGYEQDYDRPHAYHYRDFLIRAFNADMPFDQFVRWQIAGDELAPDNPLALMATGFLGAGSFPTQLTEMEFESARYDELDDMVATLGVAFLGLSTGCARCHDHKFDPIPSRDYYRLAAVFATTIRSEIELDLDPEGNARRREEFARKRQELQDALTWYEQETLPREFEAFLAHYDPATRTVSCNSGESGAPERRSLGTWTTLTGEIASLAKSPYTQQPDGSWLATGKTPDQDVVTVTATLPPGEMRALRLEALADDTLPQRGPGRAPNGNFVLGDIRLAMIGPEGAGEVPIALVSPRATHQQNADALSVAASLDSDPVTGWAVDGGGIGQDQAAVFDLAEALNVPAGTKVRIVLSFQHPNKQHVLGRFRLSVAPRSGLEARVGDVGPTAEVVAALERLKAGESESSNTARATALEWFRTTLGDWQARRQALDQHVQAGDGVVLTKVMVTSEGFPHLPHHADGRGFPHFYPQVHRLQRGDVHQKQEVAQAGYLQVLTSPERTAEDWRRSPPPGWTRTSFRRAALADWITDVESGAGALLARVIVNRVWQHHFGQGLVATPNDFGFTGERPTHPELLDWLARDLIEHGWRLKRLHKLLMTSSVYLQSGDDDEDRARLDRENKLLWRRPPQRLEAEPIRDAMLAVSGLLDPTMYGPGSLDESMRRRSIYFFIKRSQLIPSMMLFDWPEHLVSIGQRATTTVAPQALLFLNNPHARQYAEAFAGRLEGLDDPAAVDRAYRLALGRAPSPAEQTLAIEFLARQAEMHRTTGAADPLRRARTDFCQALFGMNEFLYVE